MRATLKRGYSLIRPDAAFIGSVELDITAAELASQRWKFELLEASSLDSDNGQDDGNGDPVEGSVSTALVETITRRPCAYSNCKEAVHLEKFCSDACREAANRKRRARIVRDAPKGFSFVDAAHDPNFFGRLYGDRSSWKNRLAFMKAVDGLPLTVEEEQLFINCTGRSAYDPPKGGFAEAVSVDARQTGKTVTAARRVVFEAATATVGSGGEYALLLAQDHKSAIRTAFKYVLESFEIPMLRAMEVSRTKETIELSNGVTIVAMPARPEAVRGMRATVAVLDELAFYRTSEGRPLDREMLTAIRPCLATTSGRLFILSSPYRQHGALWEFFKNYFGNDESEVLVWRADARTMNPTLSEGYLSRLARLDPEGYKSEALAQFRSGTSTLFDPVAVERCVATGRHELPPREGIGYCAFVDVSGGRHDAFTMAIGHRDDDKLIVDVMRAWEPPFDPSAVVKEAADLLRRYALTWIQGDAYGAEWTVQAFSAERIFYQPTTAPKSILYLRLLPLINTRAVELLDDPETLQELKSLERRKGSGGRDKIDHSSGSHDDRANAVAGVVTMLADYMSERPRVL